MSFTTEPAIWIAVAKAFILCAVTFGLKWTPEQIAGVVLTLEAIGTLIVRQSTVTNKALDDVGMKTTVQNAIKNDAMK